MGRRAGQRGGPALGGLFRARGAAAGVQRGAVRLGQHDGRAGQPARQYPPTPDPARGRGAYDPVRWSSPAFDAVLDRALATLDPAGREAAYREAMGLAMRDRRCCRCTAR